MNISKPDNSRSCADSHCCLQPLSPEVVNGAKMVLLLDAETDNNINITSKPFRATEGSSYGQQRSSSPLLPLSVSYTEIFV